jgi:hypothetical protein
VTLSRHLKFGDRPATRAAHAHARYTTPCHDRTWAAVPGSAPANTTTVTVLGSFRETALIVEAGLTGDYVPARV